MPAPLLAVMLAFTPAADPGPDLGGFDYRAVIAGHIKLINSGKPDDAVEYLRERSKDPNSPPGRADEMRRLFAGVYAASGKPEGHEIAGYKRLSSRVCVLYVASHGEKASFLFTYWFEKAGDDWKLGAFRLKAGLNDLEPLAPFVPLDGK